MIQKNIQHNNVQNIVKPSKEDAGWVLCCYSYQKTTSLNNYDFAGRKDDGGIQDSVDISKDPDYRVIVIN